MKINAPVGFGQVATMLGEASTDLAGLCTSRRINKWSKRKPIAYAGVEALADSAFRGTIADNNAGVYYGIKMRGANSDLASLHSVTYDYVGRPAGGAASPYRLSDFDGYRHDAATDLEGLPLSPIDSFDPSSATLGLELAVGECDEDCVSIIGMLGDTNARDLLDFYPCVLVTRGSQSGRGYARALHWEDSGAVAPVRNGAVVGSRFSIPASGCPALSGIASREQVWVTFFLCSRLAPAGASVGIQQWMQIDSEALYSDMQAFAIPGAAGLRWAFEPAVSAGVVTIGGVYADMSGVSVGVHCTPALFGSSPQAGDTAQIEVSLRLATGSTARQTITARYGVVVGEFAPLIPMAAFTWQQLGVLPQAGQVFSATASAIVGGVAVDTKTFTLTI